MTWACKREFALIELVDSYLDFLRELHKYRPDLTRKENPWPNTHDNPKNQDRINDIFKDAGSRDCPAKALIIPFKNSWHIYDNNSIVHLWHIPEMFNKKILVDFGIPYPVSSKDSVFIEKVLDHGYSNYFTMDLTQEALSFVAKKIDKNIPMELLKSMPDYKIVSVGKLGVALRKGLDKYILTPIGPMFITGPRSTSMLMDFVNVRVEELIKINLKDGWTQDKILELTQTTILGLENMER